MKKWLIKYKRHLVQALFTLVTNGYAKGFTDGRIYAGSLKKLCVPGLNCYSCPGALGACPLGALQTTLGSMRYSVSFYAVGFLVAFGAAFGRFICGWLCPFGLVQDLLHKIPLPRTWKKKNLPLEKYLRLLRYAVLMLLVIILPTFAVDMVGQGDPYFCKYLCPSGTLLGGIPLTLLDSSLASQLGGLFGWKLGILIVLLLLSLVVYRPFCRYLCPLGAIYGFFNPVALYRYRIDVDKCNKCGACKTVCKLDIPVYEKPNSMDCIRCGECKKACPQGAIYVGRPVHSKANDALK